MRPNSAVLRRFEEHRNDPTLQFDSKADQCISVKIRKSDKEVESDVISSDIDYFLASQVLWDRLGINGTPTMFVESEDQRAIRSAIDWGKQNNWNVLYAALYDRNKDSSMWMNITERNEAISSGSFYRNPDEYFEILLTINYHIRCSGFVCTHSSNGCRIIDELRATVSERAHREYLSLIPCQKHQQPPCFEEEIINIW